MEARTYLSRGVTVKPARSQSQEVRKEALVQKKCWVEVTGLGLQRGEREEAMKGTDENKGGATNHLQRGEGESGDRPERNWKKGERRERISSSDGANLVEQETCLKGVHTRKGNLYQGLGMTTREKIAE